jgi:hypothetical protein
MSDENITFTVQKKVNRSKRKKRTLTLEEKMNAEFKHLKLRIRRLEQIVLNGVMDNGSITDDITNLKKG